MRRVTKVAVSTKFQQTFPTNFFFLRKLFIFFVETVTSVTRLLLTPFLSLFLKI